jgi:hypothetical protein
LYVKFEVLGVFFCSISTTIELAIIRTTIIIVDENSGTVSVGKGFDVGVVVGLFVGFGACAFVGDEVGVMLGIIVGLGVAEGLEVGLLVGVGLGNAVGVGEGVGLGLGEGEGVGLGIGVEVCVAELREKIIVP